MATKGLSNDIASAIDTVIQGLKYEVDLHDLDDAQIKSAMEAKTSAFMVSKSLIDRWKRGRNAPSFEKLKGYAQKLVDAGEDAQQQLREAFSKEIEYEDLDATKHKSAVLSKPIILQAILDIEEGVFELRQQIESGVINTEDEEFKIGFPEKFANGEIIDFTEYWKYWYNQKKDAVKLCPFGSEGKIIELEGLKVQLPKPPSNDTEILFHDLPKKEQYWRVQKPPEGITKQTVGEFIDYIHEEFRRRNEGIWFYNNGDKVYLTGNMYFALNWGHMLDTNKNEGHMDFRYAQLNLSYHIEACLIDGRSLGEIFEKSRRTGFTFLILFIFLNIITMRKNIRIGMTSKTDEDVVETFGKFSYAFRRLPFYFRPVVEGRVDSLVKLAFRKPPDNTKEAKKKGETGVDKYLNSEIDHRKPVEGAYDSTKLNYYLGDESAKWNRGRSYYKHYNDVAPTMDESGIIVGKMFLGSTIGAPDEGGRDFKKIADGSEIKDRNKTTQRTPTGLYRFALYAHENHSYHTDKYGVCHIKKPRGKVYNREGVQIKTGSMEYLLSKAEGRRRVSEKDYNDYMRTEPLTRADMYRNPSANCQFNIAKLQEQNAFNQGFDIDPIMRGNFYRDAKNVVQWRPDSTSGKFYVSWLPPKELRNRFISRGNVRLPANAWLGAGGVDSYDIDTTVDGRASNGALHFFNRFNSQGHPSRQFVLEYIHRPSTAAVFYEDVLMAAEFYGYPLLIENNKYGIIRYFQRKGRIGYVLKRPKEFTPVGSKSVKQYGIPSNSEDTIQEMAQSVERYVHYHVGKWTEKDEKEENENGGKGYREVGEMGNMYFERTLNDWMEFDIAKRTKYDATISSSLALMASTVKQVKRDNSNSSAMDLSDFIQTRKRF